MEDEGGWKTAVDLRQPRKEDNFEWKLTFNMLLTNPAKELEHFVISYLLRF